MEFKQHGVRKLRGLEEGARLHEEGRFGRLFPDAEAFTPPDEELIALGKRMVDDPSAPGGDSRTTPAGFTFLGQFIAHDITFDTTSALDRENDPNAIRDFRTPGLDLDCVYGSGHEASPYLYDKDDKDKMLIGTEKNPHDVPRNRQGVALIGDPRNDVSLPTSQLQSLFLHFHNRIVDRLRAEEGEAHVFEEAQRLARWHYQWIIAHEFVPLIAGREIVDDVLENGPRYYAPKSGRNFIPVEFAVAAYRYGHSQIRSRYKLNDKYPAAHLYTDLGAFNDVEPDHMVDWRDFFDIDPERPPQPGRKINTGIGVEMHHLPFTGAENEDLNSVAVRNLLRGKALGLPSGQKVAELLGAECLTSDELGISGEAPLWYYILKEAEVRHDGERLGEVGGRIVVEVFLGFYTCDKGSYYHHKPWEPTLPSAKPGHFTMADLVRFTES